MGAESTVDEIMRVFASSHRRRLLAALLEHDSRQATSLQISADVRAGEKEAEHLRAQTVHNHLPRLEEAGLVRWDAETNTVSKGPRFEEIRSLLELTEARQQQDD